MLLVAGDTVIELRDQHCRVQRNAHQGCICEKPCLFIDGVLHVLGGLNVSCFIHTLRQQLKHGAIFSNSKRTKLILR